MGRANLVSFFTMVFMSLLRFFNLILLKTGEGMTRCFDGWGNGDGNNADYLKRFKIFFYFFSFSPRTWNHPTPPHPTPGLCHPDRENRRSELF